MATPLETVLRLDDREFNRKLTQAEGRSNVFAQKFNRSFTQGLTRFASLGFFTAFIRDIIASRDEIVGLGEDSKTTLGKMEAGFKALQNVIRLTVAELIAPDKNSEQGFFRRFIEGVLVRPEQRLAGQALQKLGEGLTVQNEPEAKAAVQQSIQAKQAQIKQIRTLRELVSKLTEENYLAGLTNEQRREELKRRLEAVRKTDLTGLSTIEKLENAVQREQLKSQLRGLTKIPTVKRADFSALSEIGAVSGRTDNLRLVRIQDEAVKQLKEISRNTSKTVERLTPTD